MVELKYKTKVAIAKTMASVTPKRRITPTLEEYVAFSFWIQTVAIWKNHFGCRPGNHSAWKKKSHWAIFANGLGQCSLCFAWLVECTCNMKQRRFSRTRCAHDGNKFTLLNSEIYSTQDLNIIRTDAIALVDILQP
ncbi:MAG TPA: hypothetical protein VHM90_04540 [Phycisphaerae bacterium]|nr:hypothetical protein [Phycisphaerae bacterium]